MVTRNRELRAHQLHRRSAHRSDGSLRGATDSSAARSSRPIRILIIENHRLVADALEALFNGHAGLEVVGSLGSVADAQSYAMKTMPDVLIVDFHLSDGTGTDAVKALRQIGCKARVIFLTNDDGDLARVAALEAGASAFLHKSQAPYALIDGIRRVAAGASLIDPSTIASVLRKGQEVKALRGDLSHREMEVLRMVSEGTATRDIAAELGISYTTVRTHIRSIAGKLGSHSKLETVVKARDLALLE